MDYEITRKGNYGLINPIPQGILAGGLLKYMSYTKPNAEFYPNPEWAVVKMYSVKKGSFPWGLRKLVYRIFDKWCEEHKEDSYIKEIENIYIDDWNFSDGLRYYQKEAINKLIINNGGILCMPTGSGKTKTIIEYLRIMNKSSLVIVPTLDIKSQWEKQLEDMKYVRVINYQSPLAVELAKFCDIVVYDESHHVKAKTIFNIAMKTATDTIHVGCSATVKRDDGEDMKIFGAIGEIVYEISRKQLIDEGFLSDAIVYYYTPKFDNSQDKYLNYQEIYNKHIIKNEDRNNYIIEAVKTYNLLGKKILLLVSQIEHGQFLFDNISVENKIYCHGSSNNRNQDLSKFDVIVASNIFNEGVDLVSRDVLIIAGGGVSAIKITQQIGRVLRPMANKKAIIIDFQDNSKYLKYHSVIRRNMMSEDFEIVDV